MVTSLLDKKWFLNEILRLCGSCFNFEFYAVLLRRSVHLFYVAVAGICDYVYRYEAKSKEDPCCVLPSTDSAVPQFLYNMILYCCRFQYSHCVPSIGCSLRLQANYDCGSKWFLIRMFDVVGEPVDSETVQQLTWDFVAYTREVGFPHFAIAALLHTEPNIQRHSQIRLSVHALVEVL